MDRKESGRFLECVEHNFLTQLVSEPTREGALLEFLFVNREGLVGDVMVGGLLGHSNHEMIEFLIPREERRGISKTVTLDFWIADFGLFTSYRITCEAAVKSKGVQKGWTFFRMGILNAQEQAVPICQKKSHLGTRLIWLNRELLLELRKKRRVYDSRKKGKTAQGNYKDVVRL